MICTFLGNVISVKKMKKVCIVGWIGFQEKECRKQMERQNEWERAPKCHTDMSSVCKQIGVNFS